MKTPPINMVYPFVVLPDAEPVKLSRRQWMLLNYLLEHRGELVTPFQILRDVWGYTDAVARMTSDGAIYSALNRITAAVPEIILTRAHRRGWALI